MVTEQDELLVFNGINGATGEYLLPPMTVENFEAKIAEVAQSESLNAEQQETLKQRKEQDTEETFAPAKDADPKNLEETGWGVVFAWNADKSLRPALKELLDHRKNQTEYYQEFVYGRDETAEQFLARYNADPNGPG